MSNNQQKMRSSREVAYEQDTPSKAGDLYHTSSPGLESTEKETNRTLPPKASDLCHTQALAWNPQGHGKQGRPRNTWRHDTWRLKQRGWVIPGDNLRGWPRIGMPGELFWASYRLEITVPVLSYLLYPVVWLTVGAPL